jgi:hypothetical protein
MGEKVAISSIKTLPVPAMSLQQSVDGTCNKKLMEPSTRLLKLSETERFKFLTMNAQYPCNKPATINLQCKLRVNS